MSSNDQPHSRDAFPPTRWSLVLDAQEDSSEALGDLCRAYWFPLYGFARRLGHDVMDAEDLTQAFFERLLTTDGLKQARRQRGRLRSFLMSSLKNFAGEQWRRGQRQKRGGGLRPVAIDSLSAEQRLAIEPASDTTPETEFDRRWAREIMSRALRSLEQVCEEGGKGKVLQALRFQFTDDLSSRTYREVGEELGMTEATARFTAFTLRQRYKQIIIESIKETVISDDEAHDEFSYLESILAGSPA